VSASSELPNLAGIMLDTTGDLNNRKFTNRDILQIFSDRQVDGKKKIINIQSMTATSLPCSE
jgi:hypothetical protein